VGVGSSRWEVHSCTYSDIAPADILKVACWGLGAELPARSGGRAPGGGSGGLKAERVLAVGRPVEAANFSHSMHF